jgi:hypothetical protein
MLCRAVRALIPGSFLVVRGAYGTVLGKGTGRSSTVQPDCTSSRDAKEEVKQKVERE